VFMRVFARADWQGVALSANGSSLAPNALMGYMAAPPCFWYTCARVGCPDGLNMGAPPQSWPTLILSRKFVAVEPSRERVTAVTSLHTFISL
jgi:hypothetical protein